MRRSVFLLPLLFICMIGLTLVSGPMADGQAVHGSRRVPEGLVQSLRQRADTGEAEAMFHLAMLYDTGYDTIPADSLLSSDLLHRSAEAGYLPAMNMLGYRLSNSALASERREGLGWLEKAAVLGDAKAASNIGWILLHSEGVEPDYEKAFFWLQKAAGSNLPVAQSLLGDMYRYGRGVPPDSLRADSLYAEAFERGLRDAGYRLADLRNGHSKTVSAEDAVEEGLYFYNRGIPSVGVKLFRQAADEGNARAMALLGDAYTRAIGVEYNHELSLKYYYEAAQAGNPSAMFIVAEVLDIFPDAFPETADYWYQKAAESGVTDAEIAMKKLR